MAQIAPYIFPQFFDDNGDPLNGGLIYAYAAGTTTPQNTYSNAAGTSANTNPIVLSSSGRTKVFLQNLAYDFVIKNSAGETIDSISGVGSAAISGGASFIDTISELRALASGAFNYVEVGGYATKGDGGGGLFYWDATETAADLGVNVQPNSLPAAGRWVREYSGEVNVKWFGAKGDTVTDDLTAIAAANTYVASLTNGGTLYFPESSGGYLFTVNPSFNAKTFVRMEAGGYFTSAGVAITFGGGFDAALKTAFSATVGAVSFASVGEFFPQWFGLVGDGVTNDGPAIQAAINAAIASGGGVVTMPTGVTATTQTITVLGNDITLRGYGYDETRIKYTGTVFQPLLSIGSGLSAITGVVLESMTLAGGEFLNGKSSWLIYAPFFNSGCALRKLQLRDSVGMIFMQEAYLCEMTAVYCTTSTPTRANAGITLSQWQEVHGTGRAPIFICRANNSAINGLHAFRVGSVVTDGETANAVMILSGGGTAFNNISVESCADYTSGVTYNLRAKSIWVFGSAPGGLLSDEAMPGSTIAGLYNENCHATEAFVKTYSNTKISIESGIMYQIWSDVYMFDNWGSSDLHVRNLEIYRARCPELFHVLSTPGSISQGANVLFDNCRFAAGERTTEASISGGLANLFDSQSSDYPMGCAETPPTYPRATRTPFIISGYAVTAGTNGTGDYIQVGGGYFLNSYNKLVSCMRASEDNLPVWYWLAPDEASKYYRVFVGSAGQAYLVKYNSAQTEPKGDWIAEFATNGANAITGLVSNPRVTTYEGEYTPGPSGRTLTFGSISPVSGYWEVGDRCFNTAPTPAGVAFWECTTAGVPGTWSPHSLDGAFPLLLGRAGGQTLIGGTGSAERLNLSSTAHATKGQIRLGGGTTDLVYDEANKRLGIGKVPTSKIDVTESLDGGDINLDLANAFTSAGSVDEGVAFRGLFGTVLAGHLRFKKEEDFTGGTERTASATIMVRKDGADTDMIVASGLNSTVAIPNAELVLRTKTPASAAAAGTTGMIAWDASYIYICTAANTWKRVAIATW